MNAPRTIRVLAYESNRAEAKLIQTAFAECSFRCELVFSSSHSEVKTKLASGRFDLFLSDLDTDFEPAAEFLRSIRVLAPVMPIVILGSWEDATPAYLAGANAFVRKEMDVDHYFRKIHQLVQFWAETAEVPSCSPAVLTGLNERSGDRRASSLTSCSSGDVDTLISVAAGTRFESEKRAAE